MFFAEATPKTVMKLIGIPELTLYHLKSHLQVKYIEENFPNISSRIIGSTKDGYEAHGDSRTYPIPSKEPFTESTILGCAIFTAYGAMRHAANMRAGDAVAVIGISGVGSR
ncbi:hypothetical protein IFM89_003563 [Coptis chinensis]|uniref:Alcohol dehydrogenase n=1 Tax=Coptis chinensis TaxID=261450 RepID=A0A835HZE0_9MAGN|nr:hypothetical protein IFM89_003563 [Coptis chinensis]